MPEPIRVLVVDDHAVVRQGLRGLLELQDGIEVVGDAADGVQGVEAATRLRPDVILMDLVMPARDGVSAMRLLRERLPEARVIVLTSFLDDDKLLPALRAGAAGYLLKNAEPQEVVRAVRAAARRPDGPRSRRRRPARRDARRRRPRRSDRPADAPRARGAGADRPRLREQADRARARPRREDGEDARRACPREARRLRPHAGGDRGRARRPRRTAVLGPIATGGRDRMVAIVWRSMRGEPNGYAVQR